MAEQSIQQQVKGLTIVTVAMLFGVAAFTIVGIALGPIQQPDSEDFNSMMKSIVWGTAIACTAGVITVNQMQSRSLTAAPDAAARMAVFRSRTIAMVAAGEAAALLAGVNILLTGQTMDSLPGFVPLALAAALAFPTHGRIATQVLRQADKYV